MRTEAILIVLCAIAISAAPARAATFTVTKVADTADGVCDADCSLREAVIAGGLDPDVDTIVLPAGTYDLTLAGAGEDAGATGDLDVRGPVTIQGEGAATTIIDAGGIDRVLHVESGSTRVVIADVTIRGGSAMGSGSDRQGGGIYAFRSLVTVVNSVVTGNTAGRGGGIEVGLSGGDPDGADLQILGSTVSNNTGTGGTAGDAGGGIFAANRVTVRVSHSVVDGNVQMSGVGGGAFFSGSRSLDVVASTFTNNRATGGGGIGINQASDTLIRNTLIEGNIATSNGGGLNATLFTSPITIEASVVRGNTGGNGGAIFCDGNGITITDSELSANTSTNIGGAISTIRSSLTIRGTTIAGNSAQTLAGGITVAFGNHLIENSALTGNVVTSATGNNGVIGGAAVATSASAAQNVTITNSTVADNVAPAGGSQLFCGSCAEGSVFTLRNTVVAGPSGVPLCAVRFSSGPFTSGGGNLDGDGSCDLVDATDRTNVADMMLDVLQDDGGPTETIPLLAGSPAIGAAVPANCPAVDQRGFQRDADCDAGAYEADVSVDNFGCPADVEGAGTLLGYGIEEILDAVEVGDVVFCLGGLAGAA